MVVREWEKCRAPYGVAWVNYDMRTFVCYPFPLNWFARWLRELWINIRDPQRRNATERAYIEAYSQLDDMRRSNVIERLDRERQFREKIDRLNDIAYRRACRMYDKLVDDTIVHFGGDPRGLSSLHDKEK